eukprot:CAMPEP_0201520084 /NCGR_PEP_ID=MMETSP0161_2-20130828/10475_1 /ASSEMBLY_ACC=CAM_ASM_000251 /TAXON_ID=180227 /ORGANISM="Neoparamoeba aestuarina, Strain SoJaBio B1-5/56/2" /LENGTH=485 /DNA_ID=CAMNT_0047918343 /DNA_START=81 /DNA_END=1539 /DNA_ORIENTATION=-
MASHRMTEGYTNLGTTFRIRRAQHRAKGEHIKAYKNPRESAVAVGIAVEKKVSWAIDKFIVLAFMAGCYVGVGATAAASIASQIEDPAEAAIVFALFYPIGLFLVLFVGGELFTGNLMYYTFSLMQGNIKKTSAAFALITTFFVNWAGCVATAYFFGVLTEIFDNRKHYLINLAIDKVSPSWYALLLRGIPANFLACTAIFTFKSGEDIISKIFAIWVPAMTFLVADFEHAVTNMFLVTLGIFLGAPVSYGKFIYWNLIPVTIGNFIGGGLFVGGAAFYLYSFGENPQQVVVSRKPKGFNFKKWSFLERRRYMREMREDDSDEEPDRNLFDFRPSLDTGYTYNINDNNNSNTTNMKRYRSNSDTATLSGATQHVNSEWEGELRFANRTIRDDEKEVVTLTPLPPPPGVTLTEAAVSLPLVIRQGQGGHHAPDLNQDLIQVVIGVGVRNQGNITQIRVTQIIIGTQITTGIQMLEFLWDQIVNGSK